MLHYMLCVSRFAHFIKVLMRDKTGKFSEAGDCQRFLNDWIADFVNPDRDADDRAKARRPLREASIVVTEKPGSPGKYQAEIHLCPHFELDELSASIQLKTELAQAQT